MKKYKLGTSPVGGVDLFDELEIIKNVGFEGFHYGWVSLERQEQISNKAAQLGLFQQSIHSPFSGDYKVKYLWDGGEKGDFVTNSLIKCVEDCGSRAWVWSDYGWEHKSYYRRCPKSVVQSNWYYDEELGKYSLDPKINKHAHRLVQFHDLDKAGFDQIPCGTNWSGAGRRASAKIGGDDIIEGVVKYCRQNISQQHLLGFLMAPWRDCATRGKHYDMNMKAIDLFADALG